MNKIILASILLLPIMASASRYNDIEYGRVVEVEPIFDLVSVPEERQVCDRRQNNHRQRNERHSNTGRAILGGIIGGAIGNRFGKGRGRDASTALGVMIGASIGADSHEHRPAHNTCYIETYYRNQEQLTGYDVTYEYNNELYRTKMQQHPGDRVRLRVNIDVIDY